MARQFGQAGGNGPGGGRGGAGGRMTRAARPSTVWIPAADGKGDPKMVEVRTGITDGRYTQIVSGEIKAGDKVIVGLATAKAATGGSPMGAPAGGGRRGF
jgi:HlyD family secretion protein